MSCGRLFLLTLLFAGCTFKSDDIFVNPITPPPDTITASVDILSPAFEDPFVLAISTQFLIRVIEEGKFEERSVSGFNVTVDGTSISYGVGDDPGIYGFELNPLLLGNGTFDVVVEAKISTNSGSLADKLRLEYYLVTKSFQVIVNNTPVVIQSFAAATVSGYLDLSWAVSVDYPIHYTLRRTKYTGVVETVLPDLQFSVASLNPHLVDSGYVGGKMQYLLYRRFPGSAFPDYIGTIVVHKPAGAFVVSQSPQNVASVSWTPHYNDATLSLIKTSGNQLFSFVSGQTELDTIFLGDNRTYRLNVQRNEYAGQQYDTTIQITRASNLPSFTKAVIPGGTKLILLRSNGALSRHAIPGFSQEEYYETVFPHRELLANSQGQPLVTISKTIPDPMQLNVNQVFWPRFGNPDDGWTQPTHLGYSSLSDNQLLGMSIMVNGSPRAAITDITLAVDPAVEPSIIWMDSVNTDLPMLSIDGLYFCVNQMDQTSAVVYKRVASVFQPQGNVPPYKRSFRGPSSTELVVMGSSAAQVYNANAAPGAGSNYTTVRSFTYPVFSGETISKVDYDKQTQQLWIQSTDQWYYSTIRTYAITTFAMTHKVKAYLPPANPLVSHVYISNHHFLTSGHGEPVQP